MLRFYFIFILTICLASCDFNSPNWPVKGETELEDSSTERRFILVDKVTCKLPQTENVIYDSLIIGKWSDSLLWLHEEDCMFAVDQIDQEYNVEFKPSERCIWVESFTYQKLNKFHDGVFWTEQKNDSNFLIAAFNKYRDTTFDHGDTFFLRRYYINYFDTSNLFITAFNVTDKVYDLKTIQLKKE